ncbi:MAG: hypothetical protein ACI95C_000709 [Pseudohongiellaceae bacterium]|jgi:hypothetical protein
MTKPGINLAEATMSILVFLLAILGIGAVGYRSIRAKNIEQHRE